MREYGPDMGHRACPGAYPDGKIPETNSDYSQKHQWHQKIQEPLFPGTFSTDN